MSERGALYLDGGFDPLNREREGNALVAFHVKVSTDVEVKGAEVFVWILLVTGPLILST